MAKYTVKMSCSHEEAVNILGRGHERESKIRYYEEYGMCKDCYKKWMQGKNEKIGLLFHAEILREIDEEDGSLLVEVWFTDNTTPYKDQIKSLGYKWTARNWVNDWCWLKKIKFKDVNNEVKQAEEMGATIVEEIQCNQNIFYPYI